jgi:hypothetical protein
MIQKWSRLFYSKTGRQESINCLPFLHLPAKIILAEGDFFALTPVPSPSMIGQKMNEYTFIR